MYVCITPPQKQQHNKRGDRYSMPFLMTKKE